MTIKIVRYHSIFFEQEDAIIWLPIPPTAEFYGMLSTPIPPEILLLQQFEGFISGCENVRYYKGKILCLRSDECMFCPIIHEWECQVPEEQWEKGAICIEYPSLFFASSSELTNIIGQIVKTIVTLEIDTIIETIWDCGTKLLLFSHEGTLEKYRKCKELLSSIPNNYFEIKLFPVHPNLIYEEMPIISQASQSRWECTMLPLKEHIERRLRMQKARRL